MLFRNFRSRGTAGRPLGERAPGEHAPRKDRGDCVTLYAELLGYHGWVGARERSDNSPRPSSLMAYQRAAHAILRARVGALHVGQAPATPRHPKRSCSTVMPAALATIMAEAMSGRP